MNLNYLGILTLVFYLYVALAQGLHLFGRLPYSQYRYMTGSLLCIIAHGWILYKQIETPQGQNVDWLIMLSLTLWLMNIFMLLTSFRTKVENLCVLTYPLTALSLVLTLSLGGYDVINTKTQPDVLAHIFISLFALSLLTLASLQAVLVGLQNFLLKHHYPSPMLRILPPLQTMEDLLFHIIWGGLLFLSASLLSGFLFQAELLTYYLLPKTLLSLCAWVLLTFLLVGRYLFGWRGATAIRWTLSGTWLAFLSYFGTKAFLT